MIRFAALAFVAAFAVFACTPSQPPETPESPSPSADPAASSEPAPKAAPAPSDTPMPGKVVNNAEADKGASNEPYELTPSDCDALGRQYGSVTRADLLAPLSEKQRAATAGQIDELAQKRADGYASMCMNNLVNKAVDHGALKCAFAAKTVKQFDVCLNGEGGTPQPAAKGKGKKK